MISSLRLIKLELTLNVLKSLKKSVQGILSLNYGANNYTLSKNAADQEPHKKTPWSKVWSTVRYSGKKEKRIRI